MKKLLSVLVLLLTFFTVSAQFYNPVTWEFSQENIGGDELELTFTASIEGEWYMYSQHISDDGPVPTTFTFFNEEGIEVLTDVLEPEPVEEFDSNFDMVLKYFKKKVSFTQRIKSITDSAYTLNGEVMFMTCDPKQCLPPEYVEFSFNIPAAENKINIASSFGDTKRGASNNMLTFFFLSFLSGLIALITPCVLPMIPMTVSYFLKQSQNKTKGIVNSIIYGVSIVIIYLALGVGVSAIFGADALNNMATNVYFNFAFFLLLLVFAASFLGAFELTLPNSWINKADKASDKGGFIGIFFMAFTLALVSFSCTGPIVGTLLVEAASGGNYLGPIVGMLGFSLAIALPFTLFSAFPAWLNSLPKSGGWLNSVKVVLGLLELALAFKFLSNVDLVTQSHMLEREFYIAIWIIIFTVLTIYLLGFIKFSHDSDLKYVSVPRLFFAIFFGAITIYMIPGLWGAPLKIINDVIPPPPLEYSESPHGVGYTLGGSSNTHKLSEDGQHLGPQGIMVFHDYDAGLEHAKKIGKPVMLDFTGWACVNCRKMEQNVWSDTEVKRMLTEDVVLISLYVDERTKLSKEQQYETTIAGKKKKVRTVGDQWMVLQAERYKTNSQPYYVMIDHDENQLGVAANYQDYGKVDLFKNWLQDGLNVFNK
ncbi:MAG: thiol:disulfide interchange protein [Flavobacteriales bacterium]|nr:thiol:disulfide interchange protein [Flavobacteriales bacterium]|tara:strand:+ start:250 stop:2199 length:1950 start_codon:yes stop_codon:yes gene_type:complete